MRIARIRIANFRGIRSAEILPAKHNVLLGPNNCGKTTVLEAINLVLGPEITNRPDVIDENDFFLRKYLGPPPPAAAGGDPGNATAGDAEQQVAAQDGEPPAPVIRVELVLAGLNTEDEDVFRKTLVPWRTAEQVVVEATDEGEDPFDGAESAIRIVFEGWYEPSEDDFQTATYFLVQEGVPRETCPRFTREQKRHVGFLIYRDFRALTRPVTLDPVALFNRVLQSHAVLPRRFEDVLTNLSGRLGPTTSEADFEAVVLAYATELERYLTLTGEGPGSLSFEVTDRTRAEIKAAAQLYVSGAVSLPIQTMGAGTRSLAILAMLTLIMRHRGRGILALEEPETFLFPHAQRRVVDECLALADQTFLTTHSPYVLERIPLDGVGRVDRGADGAVTWTPIALAKAKQVNLYSRYLRSMHCEALVGRGAVVVEGESDRRWLVGGSALLRGQTQGGRRLESLELQGIAVVPAEGDVVPFCDFYEDAGLPVLGFGDLQADAAVIESYASKPYPVLLSPHAGLEDLLVSELPLPVLRKLLADAPHTRTPRLAAGDVAALSDDEVRARSRDVLIANKGAHLLHEWLIAQLQPAEFPRTLTQVLILAGRWFELPEECGVCSVVPR